MLPPSSKNSSATKHNTVWTPQAGSQTLFLNCPIQECLYSGTRGPGKTDALLMDFAQDVDQGWGAEWQGILFRETYPQLEDVIKKSRKWFPRIWKHAEYNKSDKCWTFPRGEQLRFRHMDDPEDYWNYHGHAYPWIGWEELTNWMTPDCFTSMFSCNRSPTPGIPKKIRATTNPYGRGHNWVRKRYQLPEKFGQIIREIDEDGNELPERVALHGKLIENKILLAADPKYVQTLRAAARNPQQLLAWIHGSWNIVAGGAFDDVWDGRVHVKKPFFVPANWRVFRSYDWGSARPFSIGFWVEATGEEVQYMDGSGAWSPPRGSLIRIHEIYGTKDIGSNEGLNLTNHQQADLIVEKEAALKASGMIKTPVMSGPADNAIFDKDPKQGSIALDHESKGIYWERSNKSPGSRTRGLELARQRLENGIKNEGPGLFFVDTCRATIELLPRLHRGDDNPEDIDKHAEDHFWDEIRYTILSADAAPATEIPMRTPR